MCRIPNHNIIETVRHARKIVCNTNLGLKGFAFIVRSEVRGRYQLAHYIPELLRLLCLFLLFFCFLLFRTHALLLA